MKKGDVVDKLAFSKKLREARLSKGYTQEVLAEKANISAMYLGEIERGGKMPSLNIFIKLVEALDISADYILRDELSCGKMFIFDEITNKLKDITPRQRKTAIDILDAYLKNL